MPIPRIVLDTAAFITAMRSKNGAAQEVLAMIAARRIILVMDLKIALEYRAVALRNEHLLAAGLSHKEMLIAITDLENFAEPFETSLRLRPLSVDPNDGMIIELAVDASVDAIVTGNTKHFEAVPRLFGIDVFTPLQFLQEFERQRAIWQIN